MDIAGGEVENKIDVKSIALKTPKKISSLEHLWNIFWITDIPNNVSNNPGGIRREYSKVMENISQN